LTTSFGDDDSKKYKYSELGQTATSTTTTEKWPGRTRGVKGRDSTLKFQQKSSNKYLAVENAMMQQ